MDTICCGFWITLRIVFTDLDLLSEYIGTAYHGKQHYNEIGKLVVMLFFSLSLDKEALIFYN